MLYLFLLFSFLIPAELEVDGNLKVTGTVDANGNPISNVGEPVLTTDVATANYVLERTAGKGRIIILKCPWIGGYSMGDNINECEPPSCPENWTQLILYNELVSASGGGSSYRTGGNMVRLCEENEE